MTQTLTAVVPAAGVGSRMKADRPKQYLTIAGKTILEHTVDCLLQHPAIGRVVIAISDSDPYFNQLPLSGRPEVVVVQGGAERADSVFAGLAALADEDWVLVHDAARPCLHQDDITRLIDQAKQSRDGAILAAPVRDTMKRGNGQQAIASTVDRTDLWHALTPQMFLVGVLRDAMTKSLAEGAVITDEASALEYCGYAPTLVPGRADNLKVTQPEDLALAEFYLQQRRKEQA
ncbi:2-C-methyl-D-erythritol 4-phosphate cytidylyltransferase [Photobacterium galatheae]|uniref:2-C-methyl-D-erythritol 4-phosphate cytidylyltransferase n=1 Tax=Photobacterium galatheae TaxID=1654360 RepID=A0A066RU34_9GAMM|nr:2-C-methyl-D-erythritol 4-phosphate cytidylyltransferase [Photobacterium galatheae]KDM92616.1 2-C-methyl-D-erythritol 4-phosphate cytidylyltransferase [Photobacterium galatheae]MCM0149465.1 2-C-methyl-D-erythritol 4-phosphate cytidylyltransferase [Photobacterium galatheae]